MTKEPQTSTGNAPAYIAYHVPDRRNAHWARIGAAWPHKDGKGFNLKLELLPADGGNITLRVYEPDSDRSDGEQA